LWYSTNIPTFRWNLLRTLHVETAVFLETDIHTTFSRYNDLLRPGRSRGSNPGMEESYAPVQIGLWAHPMNNGSLPGVKRPGLGVGHPPVSSSEIKGNVQLYVSFPPCLHDRVNFFFYCTIPRRHTPQDTLCFHRCEHLHSCTVHSSAR